MHLKPHDYRINYVNIDLHHQYGISVAETQTSLLANNPSAKVEGETAVFLQATTKFLSKKIDGAPASPSDTVVYIM